jgi:glycosyltransferase involved in cell wall biosynthesis
MTSPVFLNGRFFTQGVTGVQRFAAETTAAIDRLAATGEWPDTTILAPRMARSDTDGGCAPASYPRLRLQEVGRTRGHLWEQTVLPMAARSGILVSLGNTAPVLLGSRQAVVIHDAGVFDTPGSYSLQFRLWYRFLQRRLIEAGAQVVTVSEFSSGRIGECLDIDPSRVVVMYEGADHILRVPPDHGMLDRFGLRPRKFVLIVGAGAPHKNINAMSEAAAFLEQRGIVLVVVGAAGPAPVFGTGSDYGRIGRRLGRVTDSELRALYESAFCLLFPSRYEGFGLPPVEAMACGCPVLASCGGAVEEICGDGALYFTAGDRRTVADMLQRMLEDEHLACDLRARGIARARTFSWDASARVLARVVRDLQ